MYVLALNDYCVSIFQIYVFIFTYESIKLLVWIKSTSRSFFRDLIDKSKS